MRSLRRRPCGEVVANLDAVKALKGIKDAFIVEGIPSVNAYLKGLWMDRRPTRRKLAPYSCSAPLTKISVATLGHASTKQTFKNVAPSSIPGGFGSGPPLEIIPLSIRSLSAQIGDDSVSFTGVVGG